VNIIKRISYWIRGWKRTIVVDVGKKDYSCIVSGYKKDELFIVDEITSPYLPKAYLDKVRKDIEENIDKWFKGIYGEKRNED